MHACVEMLSAPVAPKPETLPRVVVISPYGEQRGGAELSLLHALRLGRSIGIEWALAVAADGGIANEARSLGLPVSVYGESRTRDVVGLARSVAVIRRLVRKHDAQLILSWVAQPHVRGALASMWTGVPAVWFRKGGVDPSSRTARWIARLPARAILANSVYTAGRQAALQDAIGRPRPIHVVPSAVDTARFDPDRLRTPSDCRSELGLPKDRPLVVMVGRLQAWKGFHVLIEAMRSIREVVPEAMAVLVGGEHEGEPGYAASLDRRTEELGLRDAIRITGFVPHETIPRYMQAGDVIVHASIGEPFGIVVVEAMALGKPVVAANEGGPATVIRDGVDGLLVPPTEPRALSLGISRILRDSAFADRLGRKARQRSTLFSIEQFGHRLATALRSAVQGANAPGIYADDALINDTPCAANRAAPDLASVST